MTHSVRVFARAALWALPLWAALLFLSTITHQPDTDTDFAGFAAYVTTPQFLVSHIIGSIAGAAIGSIGAIALMLYLQDTRVAGRALAGMAATVFGNTMLAAIFGVAAFAQTAMGRMYLAGQANAVDFYNQTYSGPLFATALVALLLFIAGGVFLGAAISGSGRFPRWAGWVYAIAVFGFAVSNFTVPVGQSLFSALMFIATVTVAWIGGRQSPAASQEAPVASP